MRTRLELAVALAWGLGLGAIAGTKRLDGAVIPGGGGAGTSEIARFQLIGSIGQPMATGPDGGMEGLVVRSGFWARTLRWINALPSPGIDVMHRRAGVGVHFLAEQLLANDGDGDWDALDFVSVASATEAGGRIYRDGPWIVYVPPAGGGPPTDTFSYQVGDGLGGVTQGIVVLQVEVPALLGGGPLVIRFVPGPPERVEVRFQGIARRYYRIQTASDAAGPWSTAGDFAADARGVLLFTEGPQTEPRFYRVVEP